VTTHRGWQITSQSVEVPTETRFVQEEPTGRGWGRCGCGHAVEGPDHAPILLDQVVEKLQRHIATDHPEWPEELWPS